jgi:uncharacterized protein
MARGRRGAGPEVALATQVTQRAHESALEVNVAGLLGEGPGVHRDVTVHDLRLPLDDDLELAQPVRGTIRLARTNRGLLLSGHLDAALRESCARCLRDVEVPIGIDIDEEALPTIDLTTGAPVDTSADPEAVRLSDHHELDLEPLIREGISLAEPIAPLCRPDCPGLCTVCGGELATGDHDHDEGPIDPRLEALRTFRVDGDDGKG